MGTLLLSDVFVYPQNSSKPSSLRPWVLGDQETGAMVSEAVEAAPESTNGPGLGQKHAARSSAAGEPQQRLTTVSIQCAVSWALWLKH